MAFIVASNSVINAIKVSIRGEKITKIMIMDSDFFSDIAIFP